jgi:hydroxymethylglutaryl-CoA lyase
MPLPDRVIACECWARDGLQSMPVHVSTAQKIEMIERAVDAGFPKVEVTSFSHPKLLSQFADAVDVLKGLHRRPGASYVVLMPNTRGFDRLEICQKEGHGADEIILMISCSEAHNKLNFRMGHDEAMAEHAAIMKRAHGLGIRIIGCVGTVYGCPVAGDVTTDQVAKIARFYLDEGAQTIMLGDTTGVANPRLVRHRGAELMVRFPGTEFIAHFTTRAGPGSSTRWHSWSWVCATSTARWARSAASPRRARRSTRRASPATPAARTWSRCSTRWAWRPGSTSTS